MVETMAIWIEERYIEKQTVINGKPCKVIIDINTMDGDKITNCNIVEKYPIDKNISGIVFNMNARYNKQIQEAKQYWKEVKAKRLEK